MGQLRYELIKTCSHSGARRGRLHTAHGVVELPAFMPVGTQATVKSIGSDDLESLGFQQILSNTYHLELRPGSELIQNFGGLHKFMSWNGAILTDSGGYQVMSLSANRKITEEGVLFRSHLDGSEFFLSPERAITIQNQLGVDMAMALDVCPPYPCSREEAAQAMAQTHRWAQRNLSQRNQETAVFGIVQGGIHEDLRRESAEFISEQGFDGIAIGGVSVGEPSEMQRPVVELTAPLLPQTSVRYLMGVGHPADILHAANHGIDLFDCVLPTRMARHNCLYTLRGRVNISNQRFASDHGPVDPDSVFPQTQRYSAAYLRHLFKTKESLGPRIATLHNLAFYSRLMADIRAAIEEDTWPELLEKYRNV